MEPSLEIKDLKIEFGTFEGVSHVLEGIYLTLGRGDTLGLVGETGCGKSITAKAFLRLLEEFRRRRGYDPLPFYPTYTGRIVGSLELSERFLWDVRKTGQELVIVNHAERLKELGRRYGLGLSIEAYDMNPTADLALGAVADVPMCEFWSQGFGFDTSFSCLEAASIAHTCGRPIVAAEAFTAGREEAMRQYPGSMKNQGDWAFCAGVNRFVFHTFAHQPFADARPGMTMGPYGVHWHRNRPGGPWSRNIIAICPAALSSCVTARAWRTSCISPRKAHLTSFGRPPRR